MDYTLPKLKDLRIDKLEYFEILHNVKDLELIPIRDRVKLNSVFTGLDEKYLLTVTKQSNYKLSKAINELVEQYTPKAIPTKLKFDGQVYTLREDLGKMPTAFWVDISNQDIEKNPIRMASSIYIEEGMQYSELDANKNWLNPVSKRDKIFKEQLPLETYLDIQGFFLTKYNELTPLYMEAKKVVAKSLKIDMDGTK